MVSIVDFFSGFFFLPYPLVQIGKGFGCPAFHAAWTVCKGNLGGRLDNGSHLFVWHHTLHLNVDAHVGRRVFKGFR